jgi:transketolase
MFAGHHKLNNLRIFVDNNGQSQIGETDNACSLKSLSKKISAFNFKVIMVDGNSFFDLDKKIKQNINSTKPTAFICNTIKGKGVSFMEKNNLWHYKTPKGEELKKSLEEIKI